MLQNKLAASEKALQESQAALRKETRVSSQIGAQEVQQLRQKLRNLQEKHALDLAQRDSRHAEELQGILGVTSRRNTAVASSVQSSSWSPGVQSRGTAEVCQL